MEGIKMDNQRFELNDEKIKIILSKSDINKFIEYAEDFGRDCRKMTTSQIRNIFDSVKKLKSFEESNEELQMLRPKLAYAKGKDHKHALDNFQRVMDRLIKSIDSNEKMKNFVDFFEATIAYHRAYGGKE
jgi:CRISPR-associated protein Csm2